MRTKKEHALDAALAKPDYLVVTGSRLYGSNTPDSDQDERGFIVPPYEYIIGLGRFDQRVELEPVDRVLFSVQKLFALLRQANPQAYELLWVPEDKILRMNEVGRQVREARTLFASKRFYRRIMGYAESEWRKVKGVTLVPIKRTPTEDDVVSAIRNTFHPDRPEMDEVLRLLYLKHDRKEVSSRRKLGEKRKGQIERHGFCVSSASQSIRLLGELVEFLKTGGITFPRRNADFLREIKHGEVSYDRCEQAWEAEKAAANEAMDRTELPEQPDDKAINDLYQSILLGAFMGDARLEHVFGGGHR